MRQTAGVCSSLAPFPTTISLFLHLPTGHDTISSRRPISRLLLCSFALPAEWRTRVALFGRDDQRST